ncbi:hypothetical protein GIB67_039286 [Kingdonia uniflora]|uniref:RNA helicase n=1 Tax=Kingdonia uniflora TaxID=39325 RepID=A0A7J7MLZ6_9MAGN|nr:hypothetical protein GIB67_039286 [Kingdonia uniflora]
MDNSVSFLFSGLHFDRKKFANDFERFRDKKENKIVSENDSEMENVKSESEKKRKWKSKSPESVEGFNLFKGSKAPATTEVTEKKESEKAKEINRQIERDALLRKKHGIHISGNSVPSPLQSFEELSSRYSCKPYLLHNIAELGFKEPTPIQRQALSVLLSGQECFVCAPTGSGKTLAFLCPILVKLQTGLKNGVRAVILSPTRELAMQTTRECKKLAKGGKFRIRLMTKELAKTGDFANMSCDVIVSTPLRLHYAIRIRKLDLSRVPTLIREVHPIGVSDHHEVQPKKTNTTLKLILRVREEEAAIISDTPMNGIVESKFRSIEDATKSEELPNEARGKTGVAESCRNWIVERLRNRGWVEHLVFDESDKLFELGFVKEIDYVVKVCTNPSVIRSLFSATLPDYVEELARTIMHDAIRVIVGRKNSASGLIKQKLVFTGREEGKLLALRQSFRESLNPPILIFVQSKERARELYRELELENIRVDVIHADLSPEQREEAVDNFRAGKTWVLIATDVIARGMDFKGVNCVINYDFPESASAYIHRIGRCGRAGRTGEAITFFTEQDTQFLRNIANVMVASGCEVPSWILNLPKLKKKKHRPTRESILGKVEDQKDVSKQKKRKRPHTTQAISTKPEAQEKKCE